MPDSCSKRPRLQPAPGPSGSAVCWWSLGGLGTFVDVMRSLDLGLLRRMMMWAPALVSTLVLGLALTAQAAPAPAKPTPVKPSPVKPTAAQPKAAQPTKLEPKPAASPAKLNPKPAQGPAKLGGKATDPFTAGGTTTAAAPGSNPNVRESELYGDRLDNLQTEVDQLKDKIFRSKARLTLLKETVLRGVLAGSRVTIAHQNLMGAGFRLTKVVFIMDGAQIFARTDETGSLDGEDEIVVYDGNLPPGAHNVTVELVYQGNGFGVFSYLSGYTFESRSSHSFTAPENGAVKLVSQGFERGNMTTEMADRPAVNWQEVPLDASGRPLPKTRSDKAGRARLDKDGK